MIGRTNCISVGGSGEKHYSTIIVSTDYLMGQTVNCRCDDVDYNKTLVFDSDGEAVFTVNDWGTYTITADGKTVTVIVAAWYQEYTVEFAGSVEVTFTVEGAKGDNITIKKADGTIVNTLIFGSNDTTKQTTLTIPFDGDDFTFESSVAKATDGSGADYSKTISITSITSKVKVYPTDSDNNLPFEYYPWYGNSCGWVSLPTQMTSNTTPSGTVTTNITNYYTTTPPYKAVGGGSCFVLQDAGYIQYQFASPTHIKKVSVSIMSEDTKTRTATINVIVNGNVIGTVNYNNDNKQYAGKRFIYNYDGNASTVRIERTAGSLNPLYIGFVCYNVETL